MEVYLGTIYDLDWRFSLRVFLDTTFLAAGKTTKVGNLEVSLRDLLASFHDNTSTYYKDQDNFMHRTLHLTNKLAPYTGEVSVGFKFVFLEQEAVNTACSREQRQLAEEALRGARGDKKK